jgi:hypothetical protein
MLMLVAVVLTPSAQAAASNLAPQHAAMLTPAAAAASWTALQKASAWHTCLISAQLTCRCHWMTVPC